MRSAQFAREARQLGVRFGTDLVQNSVALGRRPRRRCDRCAGVTKIRHEVRAEFNGPVSNRRLTIYIRLVKTSEVPQVPNRVSPADPLLKSRGECLEHLLTVLCSFGPALNELDDLAADVPVG